MEMTRNTNRAIIVQIEYIDNYLISFSQNLRHKCRTFRYYVYAWVYPMRDSNSLDIQAYLCNRQQANFAGHQK